MYSEKGWLTLYKEPLLLCGDSRVVGQEHARALVGQGGWEGARRDHQVVSTPRARAEVLEADGGL